MITAYISAAAFSGECHLILGQYLGKMEEYKWTLNWYTIYAN